MKLSTKWPSLIVYCIVIANIFTAEATANSVRTVINTGTRSSFITVAISPLASTISESSDCFAVEELLPFGLSPLNISNNGQWDELNHKVKWGPFSNSDSLKITYEVFGSVGIYDVSGVISIDGKSKKTNGDSQVNIIQMARRLITNDVDCSTSIKLEISPIEMIKSYAVEEIIGSALTPFNISEYGVWNQERRSIKWGPFSDNNVRTLNYDVSGPPSPYIIEGSVSFDGESVKISGNSSALIRCNKTFSHVATPVIDMPTGLSTPFLLTIICETPDAKIYYTTDGSLPYSNSNQLYKNPLQMTSETTVRAVAIKEGMKNSTVAIAFYREDTVHEFSKIVRTITDNATHIPTINLNIKPILESKSYAVQETLPPGLRPDHLNENGIWNETSRTIKWGPFDDHYERSFTYTLQGPNGTYELENIVSVNGKSHSISGDTQVIFNNVLPKVEKPVFSQPSGTNVPVSLTITCSTPDAEIRYTTDGTVPDTQSKLYNGEILEILSAKVIRSRAFKTDMQASDIAMVTYTEASEHVDLTKNVSDNHTCTPSLSITIKPTENVKSYAFEEHLLSGITPLHINANGIWDQENKKIKWGPFSDNHERVFSYQVTGILGEYVINSALSVNGKRISITEETANISINCFEEIQKQVATPTFDQPSGAFVPVDVNITCTTPDVVIRYTTDGTLPDSSSPIYTNMLNIKSHSYLRARAFKNGMNPSPVAQALFKEQFLQSTALRFINNNQTCSPGLSLGITPLSKVNVYALEEHLPDGLMPKYINENGKWDKDNHMIKWGPFSDHNARNFTYQLIGKKGEYTISGISSFDGQRVQSDDSTIIIDGDDCIYQVDKPVFDPPCSENVIPVVLNISCDTPDSIIRYTTDCSEPDKSSQRYDQPLSINYELCFKAKAFKEGLIPSDTVSNFYRDNSIDSQVIKKVIDNDECSATLEITVIPNKSVKSYAIEEFLPKNSKPLILDNSCVWDRENHGIKCGPFDDNIKRIFKYGIRIVNGNHTINGISSFNGQSKPSEMVDVSMNCIAQKGDFNNDNIVNLFDLILLLQTLAGFDSFVYTSADVVMNNKIGIEDAIFLLKYISTY